jgi:GlpG protein
MRIIGHLESEPQARIFGDFLYAQGVENQVEADEGHGWAVWIIAEEDLDRANRLLGEFRADPAQPRFKAQAAVAADMRAQAAKAQAEYAKRMKKPRQIFSPLYDYGFGPATLLLILACVAVAVISGFATNHDAIGKLFFSDYPRHMPEIRSGEVWRLITPIFIHFNFLHILFNMMWLRDLGSLIERREGSLRFLLKVLVIGILSNLAQYLSGGLANSDSLRFLAGYGYFGGMSGVVYGLFGYVWISGKCNPQTGYILHPYIVTTMLVWFFLCFTGIVGDIANSAHAGGLIVGMAWGWLSSLRRSY